MGTYVARLYLIQIRLFQDMVCKALRTGPDVCLYTLYNVKCDSSQRSPHYGQDLIIGMNRSNSHNGSQLPLWNTQNTGSHPTVA